jgi:hypothetical protein
MADKYRWNSPGAWLLWKVQKRTTTRAQLLDIIDSLAGRLDGDSIQDLFQSDMSDDGYFRALKGGNRG